MKSKEAEKVGQDIMTGFAIGIESQPQARSEFIYDTSEWGIGFSFGTTHYGKWRFYTSFDFLCFCFIVWFGKKKQNPNKKGFLMQFEIETNKSNNTG